MKVVTPYRPFAPESAAHRKLGPFDWLAAIDMLRVSVRLSCRCDTYVLTDLDSDVPGPVYRYAALESRLMLWLLEVWLRYLESPAFDQDTVMISPDALVFQDLRSWFRADLGLVVRSGEKYEGRRLLNGVQFWRHAAKDRLIAFYRAAYASAQQMDDALLCWGADTKAISAPLEPLSAGPSVYRGLSIYGIEQVLIMLGISGSDRLRLEEGKSVPWPAVPIADFKYLRKRLMPGYFNATIGARVHA